MVTPILLFVFKNTVRLFFHQSQVVESWTHGVGRCDNLEGELLFHVAPAVHEQLVGYSIFHVVESLFVSTLHALLHG